MVAGNTMEQNNKEKSYETTPRPTKNEKGKCSASNYNHLHFRRHKYQRERARYCTSFLIRIAMIAAPFFYDSVLLSTRHTLRFVSLSLDYTIRHCDCKMKPPRYQKNALFRVDHK